MLQYFINRDGKNLSATRRGKEYIGAASLVCSLGV